MASITIRTKDELNKAIKDKYDEIYIEGSAKDELVKNVKDSSKKGLLTFGAGAAIGGLAAGPFALPLMLLGWSGVIGGATTGLKYSKYNLCMKKNGNYYLKRK